MQEKGEDMQKGKRMHFSQMHTAQSYDNIKINNNLLSRSTSISEKKYD